MKKPPLPSDVAAALLAALAANPDLPLYLVRSRVYTVLADVEASVLAGELEALPLKQLVHRVQVCQEEFLAARTPAQIVARAGRVALAQAVLTTRTPVKARRRKKAR